VRKKRVAFYGGSFDPVHRGHLVIAERLLETFQLDQFVFIPAFHAPHKPDRKPTSAIHRYAMLALATNHEPRMLVSTMEIDLPAKPYTIETLGRIKEQLSDHEIFFVMGADSWQDIRTWRQWEEVLLSANHIVITRPGFPVGFDHVSSKVRERIVDFRGKVPSEDFDKGGNAIFFSDAVNLDISATGIRGSVANDVEGWRADLTEEVAKYVEKYDLYK
jgi:nicotinate-nucleotide adenylyltransferase